MASVIINKSDLLKKSGPHGKVSNKVKSYADHPFFVKKAKEAQDILDKHPFPKELVEKARR